MQFKQKKSSVYTHEVTAAQRNFLRTHTHTRNNINGCAVKRTRKALHTHTVSSSNSTLVCSSSSSFTAIDGLIDAHTKYYWIEMHLNRIQTTTKNKMKMVFPPNENFKFLFHYFQLEYGCGILFFHGSVLSFSVYFFF